MSESNVRSQIWSAWSTIALALVAYAFSIAPAAWLIEQRLVSETILGGLERFYYPLTYVCQRCQWIVDFADNLIGMLSL